MSADNGIYILETPTKDGGKEWRVAELAAIENMHWNNKTHTFSEDPQVAIQNARLMFSECLVFTNKADAFECADKFSEEYYVEYGINTIKVNAVF